jgi:hypothetical protein
MQRIVNIRKPIFKTLHRQRVSGPAWNPNNPWDTDFPDGHFLRRQSQVLALSLGVNSGAATSPAIIVKFALKVGQLPNELGITQIINKWLLCVKHYYHTTFGVPKKLTHSGSVCIQTLNPKAFEDIFAFISNRST